MRLSGRRLTMKRADPFEGTVLVSSSPISFLGDVDPDSGAIINRKNNLYGQTIDDHIFAFPVGKGSTVGSYIMYRLHRNGKAPLAIINERSETIVAVGAVISEIPLIDGIDMGALRSGQRLRISGGTIEVLGP